MDELTRRPERFTAEELEKICGGKLYGEYNDRPMPLSIDTRTMAVSECYFAIRGERLDGHRFIPDALRRGAALIVADRNVTPEELPDGFTLGEVVSDKEAPPLPPPCPHHFATKTSDPGAAVPGTECEGCSSAGKCDKMPPSLAAALAQLECRSVPLLIVEDTTAALGAAASEIRRRVGAYTAAVTGSVGKTTTKELTAAIFSEHGKTHMTEGNFNNLLGLPLTLMKLRGDEKASVLELGMNAGGEISRLSRVSQPDAAIITCIGRAHIEFFGSREGIRNAKLEIIDGLKEGGLLVLDGDEPLLAPSDPVIAEKKVYERFRVIRVGEGEACDVRLGGSAEKNGGTEFSLAVGDRTLKDLFIPAIGRHILRDAAYAAAVALFGGAGITEKEIRDGIAGYRPAGMRQRIYEKNGMTVIEDCYNASPESMKASLSVLSGLSCKRKIAVLGDMYELGSVSEELHREVGRAAAEADPDLLVTVGKNAAGIAAGALAAGLDEKRVLSFPDYSPEDENCCASLAGSLGSVLREGDCVLFKASRALKLEKAIGLCGLAPAED